ncbi:MAG: hypothetical protein JSV86_17240 [Gemmatimonadota bacterium]|nr:MAG: hypothetical protein JSV86_17240 [Gemmatimonadota bacterium]
MTRVSDGRSVKFVAQVLSYIPRPDRVIKTGVIAPYPVRQYDPVYLARQNIWPFIQGVRGVGPVWKQPQPEEIVAAAAKVANNAMSGLGSARVKVGGKRYKIVPGKPPRSAVEGQIQRAAHAIMQGKPAQIRAAGRVVSISPDLGRAMWARRNAFSTGTVWDMIRARQRLYRMGKHPGRGFAYGRMKID